MKLARIGKRLVPVRDHWLRTIVYFAGGAHGVKEKGEYHFWTASGEDKFGGWTVICRNRISLPYGERFVRIGRERFTAKTATDRKAYARAWVLVKHAEYIRPATLREVSRWAASHASDWKHARSIMCAGGHYRKLPKELRP